MILAGVPCDFRLDYGGHIDRGARLISANRSRAEIAEEPATQTSPRSALRSSSSAPWPRRWTARGREWEGLARDAAGPRPGAGGVDRRAGRGGSSRGAQPPAGLSRRRVRPRGRQRDRGRRRRLRRDRVVRPATPAPSLVARSRGRSGRSVSGPASPWPRSWSGPRPRSGSSTATARSATAWPRRTRSPGTASVSSRSIGNDAGWTQIARDQVEILKDDVGTVLETTDYERAAEGLGARGLPPRRPRRARSGARRGSRRSPREGCPRVRERPARPDRLPEGLALDLKEEQAMTLPSDGKKKARAARGRCQRVAGRRARPPRLRAGRGPRGRRSRRSASAEGAASRPEADPRRPPPSSPIRTGPASDTTRRTASPALPCRWGASAPGPSPSGGGATCATGRS